MDEKQPISRALAARILNSMHVNGDLVDDLTYRASMAAIDLRRPVSRAEIREQLTADGRTVDERGWIVE